MGFFLKMDGYPLNLSVSSPGADWDQMLDDNAKLLDYPNRQYRLQTICVDNKTEVDVNAIAAVQLIQILLADLDQVIHAPNIIVLQALLEE